LGIANPIAQILSAAMMLRYSFAMDEAAAGIEMSVRKTIVQGLRTKDIYSEGTRLVSTSEMGAAIRANLVS
jgi:3-isopropylmalate dehydrogenase